MKLRMLSFQDDGILARKIKEESNYCDPAHLYSATFGISRVVLWELSPIDLDGCGRLTVCANVEQELCGTPGYNHAPDLGVSFYNLDQNTSRALYQYKQFDEAFQNDIAGLLLDILTEIDQAHGGKISWPICGIVAFKRKYCWKNFQRSVGTKNTKRWCTAVWGMGSGTP